jgi:hypothetical protein
MADHEVKSKSKQGKRKLLPEDWLTLGLVLLALISIVGVGTQLPALLSASNESLHKKATLAEKKDQKSDAKFSEEVGTEDRLQADGRAQSGQLVAGYQMIYNPETGKTEIYEIAPGQGSKTTSVDGRHRRLDLEQKREKLTRLIQEAGGSLSDSCSASLQSIQGQLSQGGVVALPLLQSQLQQAGASNQSSQQGGSGGGKGGGGCASGVTNRNTVFTGTSGGGGGTGSSARTVTASIAAVQPSADHQALTLLRDLESTLSSSSFSSPDSPGSTTASSTSLPGGHSLAAGSTSYNTSTQSGTSTGGLTAHSTGAISGYTQGSTSTPQLGTSTNASSSFSPTTSSSSGPRVTTYGSGSAIGTGGSVAPTTTATNSWQPVTTSSGSSPSNNSWGWTYVPPNTTVSSSGSPSSPTSSGTVSSAAAGASRTVVASDAPPPSRTWNFTNQGSAPPSVKVEPAKQPKATFQSLLDCTFTRGCN